MTLLGVERVVESPSEAAPEEPRLKAAGARPVAPKKKKTSIFHFRLTDELRAEIAAAAEEDDRTVGAFVRCAIRKALEDRKR